MHTLDDAQAAAVLAGLRLLQRQSCPPDLVGMATDCGRFGLPSDAFLDALGGGSTPGAARSATAGRRHGPQERRTGPAGHERCAVTGFTQSPPSASRSDAARLRAKPQQQHLDRRHPNSAGGRPVVCLYEPGQDTPAGTYGSPLSPHPGCTTPLRRQHPQPGRRTVTAPAAAPDLGSYNHILIAMSGSFDSVAALLAALDAGAGQARIELHHHLVDGRGAAFMDWPSTEGWCAGARLPRSGCPCACSWRGQVPRRAAE